MSEEKKVIHEKQEGWNPSTQLEEGRMKRVLILCAALIAIPIFALLAAYF